MWSFLGIELLASQVDLGLTRNFPKESSKPARLLADSERRCGREEGSAFRSR